MQLEQYTADAICRSMGLDAFAPSGPSCVRVVLRPSFHPEVCVTVAETAGSARARMSVVALTEMLWRQHAPRRLPELREETDQRRRAAERGRTERAAERA